MTFLKFNVLIVVFLSVTLLSCKQINDEDAQLNEYLSNRNYQQLSTDSSYIFVVLERGCGAFKYNEAISLLKKYDDKSNKYLIANSDDNLEISKVVSGYIYIEDNLMDILHTGLDLGTVTLLITYKDKIAYKEIIVE